MRKTRIGKFQKLQQYKFVLIGILIIAGVSTVGAHLLQGSHAATGGTMYVTPASSNITAGSTLSLTIHENSGTSAVDSVQSSLTYPSSQLQFTSISEGGVFTAPAATDTSTAGIVRIARYIPNAATTTGDQAVVTVNFKVLATTGTATVAFDTASSNIVQASDGTNVLSNTSGGTYTVPGATSSNKATMSLSPTTGTYANGATVAVAVRINGNGASLVSVEPVISYPSTQLQYISTTEGGVYTTQARTNGGTAGTVDIIRTTSGGQAAITGDNPIVTLNFKIIGTSGSIPLTFANVSGAYDNSGTGTNILNTAGSTAANYSISTPNPSVSSLTPANGSTTGGTVVTITGSNFVNGATVSFGGVAGTAVSVKSATSIVATSPAHGSGATDVVVTQSGQSATKAGGFTYDAAACAAPGTPANLHQTGASSSSVALAWNASSAGSGCSISGYRVYRNGVFIGNVTGTTTNDSSLAANTHYSYYVVAFDNKSNSSANSATLSGVTNAATSTPVVVTTGSTSGGGTTTKATVSTPTVTVQSTGAKSSSVAITKTNNQPIPQVSGTVNLTPAATAPTNDSSNNSSDINSSNPAIVREEYYLNNKLIAIERTSPFTYNFDTTGYTNGTYTVSIKTVYADGTTKTSTQKLVVKNKFSVKYALVDIGAHKLSTALVVIVILLAIAFILFHRTIIGRIQSLFFGKQQFATANDQTYGNPSVSSFPSPQAPTDPDSQIIQPTQPPDQYPK
jgi:hypothetical protein